MRIIIIILLFPLLGYTQERLVLNNDAFLNIDGSAYLVIDNGNANAITTLGAGGNIVSEDETDVIKWNISNTTGNYIIPWTTNSGVKIPQELDITVAGSSGGSVLLSTYETATDMNTPYPSAVVNMNFNAVNKSLFVVDRFWHADARSYGTFPSGRMVLNYDPAANELAGTNTITETNLQAQRFNTTLGHWETYILLGTNDAANDRVTSIPFSAAEFFQDWILVDNTNPLPVTLAEFEVGCNEELVDISWTTTAEINNDYFVVEKSYDAITFFELATVLGAGNSNTTINYSITDNLNTSGPTYYRLKQVDFNGETTYFEIKVVHCSSAQQELFSGYFSENNIVVDYLSNNLKELDVVLYDVQGKLIVSKTILPHYGKNKLDLPIQLSKGMYLLNLQQGTQSNNIKLVKR